VKPDLKFEIANLAAALADSDQGVRLDAQHRLVEIGESNAVVLGRRCLSLIERLLDDPDLGVQREARQCAEDLYERLTTKG
jgi:hypothetical protein